MQAVQVPYPEEHRGRGAGLSLLLVFVYNEWCTGSLQIKSTMNPLVTLLLFALLLPSTAPHFLLTASNMPFTVKSHWSTVDTGQRSPGKLFSSLSGRVLLTLLLLVHTWTRKPGFGVPLKNTHMHTDSRERWAKTLSGRHQLAAYVAKKMQWQYACL